MRYWLLGICISVLVGATVACGGSSQSPTSDETQSPTEPSGEPTAESSSGNGQDAIAVVNGEEIGKDELDTQLDQLRTSYESQDRPFPEGAELAELERLVVGQLVQESLVLQEAEARDITATDEEVQSRYEETAASFADEEEFNQALEAEGLSQSDLERLISNNLRIEKLFSSVIDDADVGPATEEELRELYELASQQQELPPFEEVRAQLEAELMSQRQNGIIESFIEGLEAESNIEVLL